MQHTRQRRMITFKEIQPAQMSMETLVDALQEAESLSSASALETAKYIVSIGAVIVTESSSSSSCAVSSKKPRPHRVAHNYHRSDVIVETLKRLFNSGKVKTLRIRKGKSSRPVIQEIVFDPEHRHEVNTCLNELVNENPTSMRHMSRDRDMLNNNICQYFRSIGCLPVKLRKESDSRSCGKQRDWTCDRFVATSTVTTSE